MSEYKCYFCNSKTPATWRGCPDCGAEYPDPYAGEDDSAWLKAQADSPVCECGQPKTVGDMMCADCDVCECGRQKAVGETMCADCAELEEREAGRDYEEEVRQADLLKSLPDGDYTAKEIDEDYLF